jgi:hypothetical protein
MRKRLYSETPIPAAPKFLPGDPVRDVEDLTPGKVEYSRGDGMCCIVWDETGSREWVSEAMIEFQPGFEPTRRPRISQR